MKSSKWNTSQHCSFNVKDNYFVNNLEMLAEMKFGECEEEQCSAVEVKRSPRISLRFGLKPQWRGVVCHPSSHLPELAGSRLFCGVAQAYCKLVSAPICSKQEELDSRVETRRGSEVGWISFRANVFLIGPRGNLL